jgi:hypothetical protein
MCQTMKCRKLYVLEPAAAALSLIVYLPITGSLLEAMIQVGFASTH